MKHDGKLETCPSRRPFFINKNTSREQLLYNNNKNGSWTKDINKNTNKPNKYSPKAKISRYLPKLNSVCFEYPFDHINPMDNTHDENQLIDAHKELSIEDSKEG